MRESHDSRPRPLAALLVVLAAALTGGCHGGPPAPDRNADVALLISQVTTPGVPPMLRNAADRRLRQLPPADVLSTLLPGLSAPVPGMRLWEDEARPADDENAPPRWQGWYAALRLWDTAENAMPPRDAGRLLVLLLPRTEDGYFRAVVIQHLQNHWTPEAEGAMLGILRDRSANVDVRFAAGFALLTRTGEKYSGDVGDLVMEHQKEADRLFRHALARQPEVPKGWSSNAATRPSTTAPATRP